MDSKNEINKFYRIEYTVLQEHISPYHFSILFKRITSFSSHNYLNQCRVQIEKLNPKAKTGALLRDDEILTNIFK